MEEYKIAYGKEILAGLERLLKEKEIELEKLHSDLKAEKEELGYKLAECEMREKAYGSQVNPCTVGSYVNEAIEEYETAERESQQKEIDLIKEISSLKTLIEEYKK